jgi:hypothetical protein
LTFSLLSVDIAPIVFLTSQIAVNFDSGAIAASLQELQDKYGMGHAQAGLIGSMVYIGTLMRLGLLKVLLDGRCFYFAHTVNATLGFATSPMLIWLHPPIRAGCRDAVCGAPADALQQQVGPGRELVLQLRLRTRLRARPQFGSAAVAPLLHWRMWTCDTEDVGSLLTSV